MILLEFPDLKRDGSRRLRCACAVPALQARPQGIPGEEPVQSSSTSWRSNATARFQPARTGTDLGLETEAGTREGSHLKRRDHGSSPPRNKESRRSFKNRWTFRTFQPVRCAISELEYP